MRRYPETAVQYAIENSRVEILDQSEDMTRPSGRRIVSGQDDPALPKVLVLHDSFFAYHRLVSRLLREHCREFYALQTGTGDMKHVFEEMCDAIKTRKPDVVIWQVLERGIRAMGTSPGPSR